MYNGFCFIARLYFIMLGKRGNELLVFALAGTFKILCMSIVYECLRWGGSLTALCSRHPWEMLYIHVALQRCALARWRERERETENERVREPVSDPCLSYAPFPCAEELYVSYRSS